METLLNQIPVPELRALLEILVLAVLFYYIMRFFRGTRGGAALSGYILLLVILLLLTQVFRLDTLNWLLKQFSELLAIAFIIIFQPEIRRALAELGKQHVFSSTRRERSLIDHIVKSVDHLAERKIGALIAIEREIGMRSIEHSGTAIGSPVTPELLATIFYPHTPLHDGGVVIRENRIVAAGCIFPLSQREELSKSLGTRHRAAIGITEETDALVVVVSEETGGISVALKGKLSRGLDEERLRRTLSSVLIRRNNSSSPIKRAKEQLDLTPAGVARTNGLEEEKKVEDGDGD